GRPGVAGLLDGLPNLVVLRTLSKAVGLAGARCGGVLANAEVVELLRSVLPPYVLPTPVVELLDAALQPARLAALKGAIDALLEERERMSAALRAVDEVERVWPSSGNFLLVKWRDAASVMRRCVDSGVLLRDFSQVPGLENCLRISIGAPAENARFLDALSAPVPAP
ncbi:MAG: aminotransferase class I/II-fold pyridoxal phosphate-dependent enzyme, partial [Pseudomonadota bacterium]